MQIPDYRNSFVFTTAAVDGEEINTCRTQMLAKCTLTNKTTNENDEFFLGKECIGEAVYKDGRIAHLPTSEVAIIFSDGMSALHKKFADHEDDIVQVGDTGAKRRGHEGSYAYWTDLTFDVRMARCRRLGSREEIIAATLESEPMIGRTTLDGEDNTWRAVLEYPIVYMNVHPPTSGFQVDVGPVLLPDFGSQEEAPVSRRDLAYVMYNELDSAEFAVRTPTRVSESSEAETLHYSKVFRMGATNELFSLAT